MSVRGRQPGDLLSEALTLLSPGADSDVVPTCPLTAGKLRALFLDAGKIAGSITVVYRRSPYASLLDLNDPSHPVIVLNPDEPVEVLITECLEQSKVILEHAAAREQQERVATDLELVFDPELEAAPLAVSGDTWPATEISAQARRTAFNVIQGSG